MRAKRSGVIATIGSMGASMTSPLIGLYHSFKAAVRNLALTLDNEISLLNIKVCLIEPGYFRTPLLASTGSIILPETIIEDYREINNTVRRFLIKRDHKQSGDPKKGAQVIYDVLTSTGVANGREIPRTLALGSDAARSMTGENEGFNARIKEWSAVSESADFPED